MCYLAEYGKILSNVNFIAQIVILLSNHQTPYGYQNILPLHKTKTKLNHKPGAKIIQHSLNPVPAAASHGKLGKQDFPFKKGRIFSRPTASAELLLNFIAHVEQFYDKFSRILSTITPLRCQTFRI